MGSQVIRYVPLVEEALVRVVQDGEVRLIIMACLMSKSGIIAGQTGLVKLMQQRLQVCLIVQIIHIK